MLAAKRGIDTVLLVGAGLAIGMMTLVPMLFIEREPCRELIRSLDDSADFTCRGKIHVVKTDSTTFLHCRCPL